MSATEGATSETYDWPLVPNFVHTHIHINARTYSLSLSLCFSHRHTSDKSPSFSSRFQPVNLTHPASPHLTLPHGPHRGQGERFGETETAC